MSGSALSKLRERLNRGDSWLTYDLGQLVGGGELGDEAFEEIETRLLTADAGVEATESLIEQLRVRQKQGRTRNEAELRAALKAALVELLEPCEQPLDVEGRQPFVLLTVGVNGAGKTTTIGKLATRWRREGKSVLLAAGDTFRAAATEQLRGWSERSGASLIAQDAGADSASVIHDALQAATSRSADVVIADTAGRLHTQDNLMEELRKIRRVAQKFDPGFPHETLLVLDATSGGNAVQQARQFHDALQVTGLVLTKLDGGARGGTLLALARELKLPIRFIGVGESVDDLLPFSAEDFAVALIS